ncbi:MAG: DUF4118 domain-containing protein [Clostridiales bacterium]|nr:DUF4118 domain-containing protein [Candidatus Cacconaster stercorequi]
MKEIIIPWPAKWRKKTKLLTKHLTYSGKDFIISMSLYLLATILCLILRRFDTENDTSYVAMIFLLDVFLTALLTDGYLFSVLMAIFGMLSVDYVFTEPYWNISFTLAGFPLTFLVMMFIAIATAVITSRGKRVEELTREANEEKIHANLLRAVSHDIRTPLTGIVGATNVLMEQENTLTTEQRHELLCNANEEAQWLIGIVENLLSVTRIGAGETKINKTSELAEEVIEGAVAKFSRRYPDIQVEVTLLPEPLLVPMDPLLMTQVLNNLLENAAIHGKSTSCIKIILEKAENRCCFVVEDDGEGIPSEEVATLFNGRIKHTSQGDMKRNMGIGLSVCHAVVQAHNGRIWAENTGSGARFTVELPLQEGENA